jgi:hypothetical protein
MMRLLWAGLVVSSLVAARCAAQSPFDGTWKIDTNASPPSTVRYDYLLQNGTYRCASCDPPVEIKADGLDHKVTGQPCYDTVSVKVVDKSMIAETDKRNGRTVGSQMMRVSFDGNTATVDWTESCSASGDAVTGKDILSRLREGPDGAHAISGSWKISKRINRSQNSLEITLKLERGTFSFTDPTDQHYTAKLDGTETPFMGGLSTTMVSVKRVNDNTIEETDRRDGKVVEVTRFVVSADGKTLNIFQENKDRQTTRQFVAYKQ